MTPPTTEENQEFQEWLDYIGETPLTRWDASSRLVAVLAFLPFLWEIYFWLQTRATTGMYPAMSWVSILYYLAIMSVLPLTLLTKICQVQAETQADLQLGSLDSRWVGPLAEALAAPKPGVRSLAARALARLLPRLKTTEGGLLDDRQRHLLFIQLRARSTDLALQLAILKWVERIGEEKALEYVEPLASRTAWLPGQRRACQAARACLTALEKRLEAKQATGALATGSPSELGQENQTGAERQTAPQEEQQRKSEQPALRILFLIAAWATILPISVWKTLASLVSGQRLDAVLWAMLFFLATQLYRYVLLPRHTEAVHKLAERLDLTQIGRLIDALDIPDAAAQESARKALTQLLPRMRASDARRLNAQQRHSLYRQLRMSNAIREASFLEAILKALEQIGDEKAIPYVARLARSIPLMSSQKRVRQAAIECLPYLEARSAQIKASQTLLRASSIEEDRTTSLLRPTGEAVVADPHQLLRAASENESNL